MRVTKSLSRLAAQMERVAVFDFDFHDPTHGSGSADIGNTELGMAAHSNTEFDGWSKRAGPQGNVRESGWRWVQGTSLLTEVAAIGRSFSLMSLNLRSFERCVVL